jgi:hypothetical protein
MTTRFNRHELFSDKMMNFHSDTLRMVEDYHMDRDESWFTPLYNMLCGIWDGYYYSEMIPLAKEMGLPQSIIDRIEFTELYIKL